VRIRGIVVAAALLVMPACELTEVTSATARDVVVAEVVLSAGATLQTAYLHRTSTSGLPARVTGARVLVGDEERGTELELVATADSVCLAPVPSPVAPGVGSCFAALVAEDAIRPGAAYTLRAELLDRPPLRGRTVVPGEFRLLRPGPERCVLPPGETLQLAWTRAEGAWVYFVQARFSGLADALRGTGVEIPSSVRDPLNLLGLSIGAADTTMAFPGGLGLFDRADESLGPLLLAIRGGLPAGVEAGLAIVAADRNYVNWVRGGSFNPSGTVRVPSVSGGGTGSFGSVVIRTAVIGTSGEGPPCRQGGGPD
jgi:hypothetical protein